MQMFSKILSQPNNNYECMMNIDDVNSALNESKIRLLSIFLVYAF